jgi:hypothetical protein
MTPDQHADMTKVRPIADGPRRRRSRGANGSDAGDALPPASDPDEVAAAARLEGVKAPDQADVDELPAPPADAGELPPGAVGPAVEPARPPRAMSRPLHAPVRISVVLECPSCAETQTVEATLSARVVKDSDGTGNLALRTRAAKAAHVCGQQSLGLGEGPRVR